MLHKVRTKLKKRYYRNRGKRYHNIKSVSSHSDGLNKGTLKIFCKSNQFKSLRTTINKKYFDKKYIKYGRG